MSPAPVLDRTPPVDVVYQQNFVMVFRALDSALCRAIIEQFNADPHKHPGKIGRLGGDAFHEKETKVSWDLEIRNEGPWQALFQQIHPRIQACIGHYLQGSPVLSSFDLQVTGYKIQMYPQGEGHFDWHADSVGQSARDRVVAMVLYLNDVAVGGETEFFHQELKFAPKEGHLVLFPAGWNYMHRGRVPESGHKYIIQTFVQLKH